jgi:hypothetical protein
MKLFVFVIASFNHPIYIEMIRLRKLQLQKHNIDYCFVFDDDPPIEYQFDDNDIFFKKDKCSNISGVNPHMNPYMIIKFLKAIQTIDESNYDVIIRLNISTYINFEKLIDNLKNKPKSFVMAYTILQYLDDFLSIYKYKPLTLLSGTCIIMTPDIITFLKSIEFTSEVLSLHNDDTVLSHLIQTKYTQNIHHLNMQFLEEPNQHVDIDNFIAFRIKCNDRNNDIQYWKLLTRINNIECS